MDALIDTILNVGVFVFIGVLIWLYRKPVAGKDKTDNNKSDGRQP